MPVVSLEKYEFPAADSLDKFGGNQVIYAGWDDHLMFCAPLAFALPPTTLFSEFAEVILQKAFKYHPDAAHIKWPEVQWLKSGQPWMPDMAKSFAENGLKHKDALRFKTPGLNGLKGSRN